MWIEIENELNEWLIGCSLDCLGWLVLGQLLPLFLLVFALFIVQSHLVSITQLTSFVLRHIRQESPRPIIWSRATRTVLLFVFLLQFSSCFWAQRLITINLADDLRLCCRCSLLISFIPLSICWWIDVDGMTHGLRANSTRAKEKVCLQLTIALLVFAQRKRRRNERRAA